MSYHSNNPGGLKLHKYGNPYSGNDKPTDSQLREISRLFQRIEAAGLMKDELLSDVEYKKSFSAASAKITFLRKYLFEARPDLATENTVYINRCREKTTGKMINYRTHTFLGAPKGYVCLGMLRKERERKPVEGEEEEE